MNDASPASLLVYVVLASEFLLRFAYDNPFKRAAKGPIRRSNMDRKTKLMILALGLEAIFLFIRSIYRVAVSHRAACLDISRT